MLFGRVVDRRARDVGRERHLEGGVVEPVRRAEGDAGLDVAQRVGGAPAWAWNK